MYRRFYGLSCDPFEVSPDPYFFHPTPHHNEALAILSYGVLRRKGFVVVTGEVGTGKTLLLRCLLELLKRNRLASAFIYNPRLSVTEFLTYVLTDLHLPLKGGHTKSELLSYLNEYLLARYQRGATTALVVDEAQLLSWELLEEIRLLTNLETSQHKLLQIVLVGQPELDRKLDSEELRQLKQRIAMRGRLEPLSLPELNGYILRRLELAGANSHAKTIFPPETIAIVHLFSGGIPRLANTLCENALIAGFSKQAREITPDMIHEVAMDLRLNQMSTAVNGKPEGSDDRKRVFETLSRISMELNGLMASKGNSIGSHR
jgi:general secretion pathway protein A